MAENSTTKSPRITINLTSSNFLPLQCKIPDNQSFQNSLWNFICGAIVTKKWLSDAEDNLIIHQCVPSMYTFQDLEPVIGYGILFFFRQCLKLTVSKSSCSDDFDLVVCSVYLFFSVEKIICFFERKIFNSVVGVFFFFLKMPMTRRSILLTCCLV